jgi:hypothetical protein
MSTIVLEISDVEKELVAMYARDRKLPMADAIMEGFFGGLEEELEYKKDVFAIEQYQRDKLSGQRNYTLDEVMDMCGVTR